MACDWDAALLGEMPSDEDEAIRAYFDHQAEHGDEWYETDEHDIPGAMWEPGAVAATIAKDRAPETVP